MNIIPLLPILSVLFTLLSAMLSTVFTNIKTRTPAPRSVAKIRSVVFGASILGILLLSSGCSETEISSITAGNLPALKNTAWDAAEIVASSGTQNPTLWVWTGSSAFRLQEIRLLDLCTKKVFIPEDTAWVSLEIQDGIIEGASSYVPDWQEDC